MKLEYNEKADVFTTRGAGDHVDEDDNNTVAIRDGIISAALTTRTPTLARTTSKLTRRSSQARFLTVGAYKSP